MASEPTRNASKPIPPWRQGLAHLGARLQSGIMLAGAAGLLSACSSGSSINPVNWWHELQGGKIAEQRPPPPGATDPYPNLSTVPARPTPPDREAMRALTAALVADRGNARHAAAAVPLADPSSPSASPSLFGTGTLPPPSPKPASPPVASATLPAATAPVRPSPPDNAAPPSPPSAAPVRPVQSTPLAPPEQQAQPPAGAAAPTATPPTAATPSAVIPSAAAPTASTAAPPTAESLPPLPVAPPPRAAATPAPSTPAQPSAPPTREASGGVSVDFAPGTSALSPTATDSVKQFLRGRAGQVVAVTGYGDAVSGDPAAQTTAVSLALARAQNVANALAAAGVPRNAIRVGAEAAGRGASLRLLQ